MQPPGGLPNANPPHPGRSLLKKRVVHDPVYDLFQKRYAMMRSQAGAASASREKTPPRGATSPSRPLKVATREKPKTVGVSGASLNLNRGTGVVHTTSPQPLPAPLPPQQPTIKIEKDDGLKQPYKVSPVPLPVVPGMAPTATNATPPPRTQQPQDPLSLRPNSPDGPAVEKAAEPPASASRGRGRPKGWKPGMSYASMRGNEMPEAATTQRRGATRQSRPTPGFGIIKRRGRPPKQPSPPPRALYCNLNVAFIAFLCEWKGCKAELHNLETLRKHVEVVHVRPQREVGGKIRGLCQWGRCGDIVKVEGVERESFDNVTELRMHIGAQHLVPFGWHVGDGPRNRGGVAASTSTEGAEAEIPGYLKDAHGNQVTPSIKDQQVEDYLTWRTNRQRLRELLLKRERNLRSEESDLSDDAAQK